MCGLYSISLDGSGPSTCSWPLSKVLESCQQVIWSKACGYFPSLPWPQDESFLVQLLLSLWLLIHHRLWAQTHPNLGSHPYTIIKTKVNVFLQCPLFLKYLLSSHCDENGFCRRGKSRGGREPFTPWETRGISSSLLLLVFRLCPVRARMTDRSQLYSKLQTCGSGILEHCDEKDSEATSKLNGKEVID